MTERWLDYLVSIYSQDWKRIVWSVSTSDHGKGRKSVDLAALIQISQVPLCQIFAVQHDPRGEALVAGGFDDLVRELRKKRDAKRAREGKSDGK